MRKVVTAALIAIAVGAMAVVPSAAFAKTCSAGYVRGTIGGVQKCLRRGEFCSHSYATQYHRYGFNCAVLSGGYHLEPR